MHGYLGRLIGIKNALSFRSLWLGKELMIFCYPIMMILMIAVALSPSSLAGCILTCPLMMLEDPPALILLRKPIYLVMRVSAHPHLTPHPMLTMLLCMLLIYMAHLTMLHLCIYVALRKGNARKRGASQPAGMAATQPVRLAATRCWATWLPTSGLGGSGMPCST